MRTNVGKFKGGLRHGKGTLTFPDGSFKKGKWEFDKLTAEQLWRREWDSNP